MGKLQFQIGAAEHVRIVLPSRQPGNRDLFIGKAMVRMSGFNCTSEVMFRRLSLGRFFDQLDEAHKSLKGVFELESTNSRFKLKGSVNRKGAYQMEVVCTGLNFTQPENTEWSASVSFTCGHMDYQEAASMLKMEGESGRGDGIVPVTPPTPPDMWVRIRRLPMKRALVFTVSFVGLIACMLMGIFAAMGVCAAVFGGEIVDTVLGAKPNRTHTAFILFMLLMIPGMLVGAIGGLFGIVFPLHQYFKVPLGNRNESTRVWLHAYAKRLLDFTETKYGEQAVDPNH